MARGWEEMKKTMNGRIATTCFGANGEAGATSSIYGRAFGVNMNSSACVSYTILCWHVLCVRHSYRSHGTGLCEHRLRWDGMKPR